MSTGAAWSDNCARALTGVVRGGGLGNGAAAATNRTNTLGQVEPVGWRIIDLVLAYGPLD